MQLQNSRLEKIKIESIIPNELNPRDDYTSIDDLARNLKAMESIYGGEPINPIVVMPDKDRYRIIDGERRYRAMVKNGLEECSAIVCGSWDETDAVLTALATDDKVPLSPMAKSKGLQLYMDLDDKSDDTVETLLNIERGSVRRARHAAKKLGDKCRTMTIEQLLAAEEFADDPESMDKIAEAGENWQVVYMERLRNRERASKAAELAKAVEDAGFTIVDSRPTDGDWNWFYTATSVGAFANSVAKDELDPGECLCCVTWNKDYAWSKPAIEVYVHNNGIDPDEEIKQARKRLYHEHIELYDYGRNLRLRWMVERISNGSPIDAITDLARGTVAIGWRVEEVLDEVRNMDIDFEPAVTWQDYFAWFGSTNYPLYPYEVASGYSEGRCADYITTCDAFIKCGYELSEAEEQLYKIATGVLNGSDEYPIMLEA